MGRFSKGWAVTLAIKNRIIQNQDIFVRILKGFWQNTAISPSFKWLSFQISDPIWVDAILLYSIVLHSNISLKCWIFLYSNLAIVGSQDKETIANVFNTFFVSKIANLKENIDPNLVKDPTSRLKKAQSNNKLSFK